MNIYEQQHIDWHTWKPWRNCNSPAQWQELQTTDDGSLRWLWTPNYEHLSGPAGLHQQWFLFLDVPF